MRSTRQKLHKVVRILFSLAAFNLVSCYKNHFNVQQEWVDRGFLASSYIRTPDPRQENPPIGQRLLVSWNFPRSLFAKQLHLALTVRFWDNTEEKFEQPLERRRDFAVFFFPHETENGDRRILTYRVEAVSLEGEVVGVWEHQFWTKLITIGSR